MVLLNCKVLRGVGRRMRIVDQSRGSDVVTADIRALPPYIDFRLERHFNQQRQTHSIFPFSTFKDLLNPGHVCLSVDLSDCRFVCLFVCLYGCLSARLPERLLNPLFPSDPIDPFCEPHMPIYLSVCLYVWLCLCVCLCVSLTVFMYACLFCLYVCLYSLYVSLYVCLFSIYRQYRLPRLFLSCLPQKGIWGIVLTFLVLQNVLWVDGSFRSQSHGYTFFRFLYRYLSFSSAFILY